MSNRFDDMLPEAVDIEDAFEEIDRLNLSLEICFKNLLLTQKHLNAAMSLLQKKGLLTEDEYNQELAEYDEVYQQELERLDILLNNEQEMIGGNVTPIAYFGPIGEA